MWVIPGMLTMHIAVLITWIWEACRSMVMIWSAPATDNMLATSLADMGALLWRDIIPSELNISEIQTIMFHHVTDFEIMKDTIG